MTDYRGKKVIVRGDRSGVYFGVLHDMDGTTVELHKCRNIWYWEGAANLLQVATEGVNAANSKISVEVESVVFTDICEIVPCTDQAIACLEGAKAWKV